MNENIALLEKTTDQKPDGVFTQVIDGREYSVRVFFQNGTGETLQQEVERLLRLELMKLMEEAPIQ